MFNLNRITLIGHTGEDAKTTSNGPTTTSLASNNSWIDKQANERHTRTEWHQLVIWNDLGKWASSLLKGTALFVEGELVYEQYPRKVEATIGKKTVEVEVQTRIAKIKVQRLIRLEPAADTETSNLSGDAHKLSCPGRLSPSWGNSQGKADAPRLIGPLLQPQQTHSLMLTSCPVAQRICGTIIRSALSSETPTS